MGETDSNARCSAWHCTGVRCIESIEPQLASTTGPSRHEQKGGARDEQDNDALVNLCICQGKSRTGERKRHVGGHAQAARAALRLTLLICSGKLVTTAAVDAEENTTMTEMLMAPAASRERWLAAVGGGHRVKTR